MAQTVLRSVATLDGCVLTFEGDDGDSYFRNIEAFHLGSPQLEHYLRSNVRPDATCLDVGANIGLTAALLSHHCPAGRVIAFEASPRNTRHLRANIARNHLSNCRVIETAIGNRSGELSFLESDFAAGSHVLSLGSQGSQSTVVPVTTLDALFADAADAPRVDFIKMDIEGFEPVALAGATRLLERDRCVIFMEFNSWCLQLLHEFNPFVFARALVSAFEFSTVGKDGRLSPIEPSAIDGFMYRNMMQNGCVDDIVLRLREGAAVPPLAEMVKGSQDLHNLRELEKLRARLIEAPAASTRGPCRESDNSRHSKALPAAQVQQQSAPRRARMSSKFEARISPWDRAAPDEGKNIDLQVLRGIAIVLVLFAHLSISDSALMLLPFKSSNPGWIGVELFFVVSGYIVMQSFMRGHFSVVPFALRRIFRLYPLLLCFVASTVFLKLFCDWLVPDPSPLFSPSWETLWNQSLAIILGYHPTAQWGVTYANRALWSLSVELHFYLMLALLVAFLNLVNLERRSHRGAILLTAGLVYAAGAAARLLACFNISFAAGELVATSMFDFIALGVILATAPGWMTSGLRNAVRPAVWLVLALAIGLVMTAGSPHPAPGTPATLYHLTMIVVGIAFAMVVAGASADDAPPDWLPQWVRIAGNILGERSYAIFLLHLPVFTIAWVLGQHFGFDDGHWRWPLFQIAVSAVLLPPLVEAAYRGIELPMIEHGKAICGRIAAARDHRGSQARSVDSSIRGLGAEHAG
jgi:FkbM family methyltransferase